MDWTSDAMDVFYFGAASKTKTLIGPIVAEFIRWLESATGTSRTRITLVGHSLGGQVVGFAGERLKNPKVHRIIGT